MLDETGFYAPSMAHNALPSRPWLGISAYLSIILQYLNRFAIRSRGSVPCPMAGRRFPTFVPHVVAQSLTRVNSSNALARVMRSTSSGVVPLISAIFFITYGMFDESFRVPRCGSGAMYGQSVSRRILSSGSSDTVCTSFFAFLKVTTPPTPI